MSREQHDFFELPEPAVETQLSLLATELPQLIEKIYLDRGQLLEALKIATEKDPRIHTYDVTVDGKLIVTFIDNKTCSYNAYKLADPDSPIFFELAGAYDVYEFRNLPPVESTYPLVLEGTSLVIPPTYEELTRVRDPLQQLTTSKREKAYQLFIESTKPRKLAKIRAENRVGFKAGQRQIGVANPESQRLLAPDFAKLFRPKEEQPSLRDTDLPLCTDGECRIEHGYNCHVFTIVYSLYAQGYPSPLSIKNYLNPYADLTQSGLNIFLEKACTSLSSQELPSTGKQHAVEPLPAMQAGDIVVLYGRENGRPVPIHSGVIAQNSVSQEQVVLSKLGVGQGVFYGNTKKILELYANMGKQRAPNQKWDKYALSVYRIDPRKLPELVKTFENKD